MNVLTSNVTLRYLCADCEAQLDQPLSDITEVGTLICPNSGEDMVLSDYVVVEA